MPDGHPLGPFARRFLLEEVVKERNLTLLCHRLGFEVVVRA
jgi:hypothetical protein